MGTVAVGAVGPHTGVARIPRTGRAASGPRCARSDYPVLAGGGGCWCRRDGGSMGGGWPTVGGERMCVGLLSGTDCCHTLGVLHR